jgi:hypothetical protein
MKLKVYKKDTHQLGPRTTRHPMKCLKIDFNKWLLDTCLVSCEQGVIADIVSCDESSISGAIVS